MSAFITRSLLALLAVTLLACSMLGQDETPKTVNNQNRSGDLPFSSTIGTDVESVDISTGHLSVRIPFVSLPGRGMNYRLGLRYESGYWAAALRGSAPARYLWKVEKRPYVTANGLGWEITQPYLTSTSYRVGCGPSSNFYVLHKDSYIYHEADGSAHPLDLEYQHGFCWDNDNVSFTSTTGSAPDVSGAGMWASNFLPNPPPNGVLRSADGAILGANGALITDPLGNNAFNYTQLYGNYTDSNGNEKSEYPGGLDTLGRVIVTQQSGSNQVLYQYYDSSGTLQTYTINYSSLSVSTNFNITSQSYGLIIEDAETRSKIDSIILPNGRSYLFQYETNGYGGLRRIDFPTGAYVTYIWGTWSDQERSYRYVTSRTLTVDGQSYTWSFVRGGCTPPNCQAFPVTVTDPALNQQVYNVDHGSVTSAKIYNGSAGGTPLREYDITYMILNSYRTADETGRLPTIITTTLDNGLVDETDFDYDSFNYPYQTCGDPISCGENGVFNGNGSTSRGDVTQIREYDWGQGAPGALLRRTKKTYLNDPNANPSTAANYIALNIVDKVLTETICNGVVACAGNGDQSTQTQYEYDNYVTGDNPLQATTGVPQHDYTNYGSGVIFRGNATRVKRWRNTDGALLTTTYTYDDLGNIRAIKDPLTNTTSYDYTDNFANAFCPPPANSQAWVKQVTNAKGQLLQVVRYPCTGLVQAHKDQNDINASRAGTTYTYDLMGRQTQKNLPDGGQVATSYNDVPPVSSTTTTKITSSLNLVSTAIQDGLGRARKTQLTSDPDGTTYTRLAYDALGRKAQAWNPTRCDPDVNPTSCPGEPTYGYTLFNYDPLNRPTSVVEQDDGTVSTTYSGNCTTVTDEALKSRQSCSDALGRMTGVWEDPGTTPHLNYETDYQYDTPGNLTRVDQKGGDPNSANWRTRTFTYNSLSQLVTANNPESGTIDYSYDNDGNISTKISPAPNQTNPGVTQTISYCYDQLNRLTGKGYSAQSCPLTTPAASYFYDQTSYNGLTIGNGVGKRTGMSDASGATAWSYDITSSLGWKTTERRTINSVTKNIVTQDNFDGSIASIVYPGVRTVTFTAGTAGRPTAAQDVANSTNYVTSAHYTPPGALAALANGASINSTYVFNSRLQPCWMYTTTGAALAWQGTLCTATPSTGTIMDRKYNFGFGAADNGNVIAINNNRDTNRTQNFIYDALNRIQQAYTTGPNWGETYGPLATNPGVPPATSGIDAWGNLTNRSGVTGKGLYEPLNAAPATANQLTGFAYDAAGNTTTGGYTYNPENRLATAAGMTYTYDGDGNRVEKSNGTNGTLYWGTGPLAESDLTASATSWKEYVFFGGKRVARRDASNTSVHYFFADHLGSTSVTTNNTGATLEEDLDYYPYGGIAYGTSSDHYLFTGKERDTESGLDNFGARFDASNLGRFMTPDWAAKATAVPYADFGNPQSLNLYAYVRNNPLRWVDPDGHEGFHFCHAWGIAVCGDGQKSQQAQNNSWWQKALSYFYVKTGNGKGVGVKDLKLGPVKFDVIERTDGKDVKQTTEGKTVTTVNSQVGVKAEIGPVKLGVERTNSQEDGQAPQTKWVPGFEMGKFEGSGSEIGVGGGGCFVLCGQFEVGVQGDKVWGDVKSYVTDPGPPPAPPTPGPPQ